jgi:hypothetical protein
MRKLILTLLLSIILSTTHSAVSANQTLMPGVQYLLIYDHRTLSELYSVICETEECDIYKGLSTTKTCVDAFDKYFMKSGGSLPDCIPPINQQVVDPYPRDEIWCYASVRLRVQEKCDPIYDPTVDEFGIINNSNLTPTSYEICLRNRAAEYDVCSFSVELHCYSDCYNLYIAPCYEQYEITGDQAVLEACLASAEPLSAQCQMELCYENTYLYPNKICIGRCWSQYTNICYDEYGVTGNSAALNACLANAQPLVDQCIIDECGGDQRIYPGFIIINL